jgi:cell wall-associated NlpC family hydrolase
VVTLAAAVLLATVRVPVANVWAAPNAGHLPLDPLVWSTPILSYDERLALVGHLRTQVLYGEAVRVLERRGGWTKIAVPDQPSPLDSRGYPGWVLSWQLSDISFPATKHWVTVTARSARLSNGTRVSFGTRLPLQRRLGAVVQVTTPRGVSWLAASAVRVLPKTRADLVRSAEMFLGRRYLWGGVSAWGFDCSGLTWAVYRAHGITIPRDADAQFAAGRPVSVEDALPGDLLFYGAPVSHVAMYVGDGKMVESPNSASTVHVVPLRTADFRGARRFL